MVSLLRGLGEESEIELDAEREHVEYMQRLVAVGKECIASKRDSEIVNEIERLVGIIDRDSKGEFEITWHEYQRTLNHITTLLEAPFMELPRVIVFEEYKMKGKAVPPRLIVVYR